MGQDLSRTCSGLDRGPVFDLCLLLLCSRGERREEEEEEAEAAVQHLHGSHQVETLRLLQLV